jgi:hypothetical protein
VLDSCTQRARRGISRATNKDSISAVVEQPDLGVIVAFGTRDRNLDIEHSVLDHPSHALDCMALERVGVGRACGTNDLKDSIDRPLIALG